MLAWKLQKVNIFSRFWIKNTDFRKNRQFSSFFMGVLGSALTRCFVCTQTRCLLRQERGSVGDQTRCLRMQGRGLGDKTRCLRRRFHFTNAVFYFLFWLYHKWNGISIIKSRIFWENQNKCCLLKQGMVYFKMNYCIGGLQYGAFLRQTKETYDR